MHRDDLLFLCLPLFGSKHTFVSLKEVKLPEDIVDEAQKPKGALGPLLVFGFQCHVKARSSWEAFIQASRSRDAAGAGPG